jgi:hypothetical protein
LPDKDAKREEEEEEEEKHVSLEVKVAEEAVEDEKTPRKETSNGDRRNRQNYRDRNIGGKGDPPVSDEDRDYHEQRAALKNGVRSTAVTDLQRLDVTSKRPKDSYIPAQAYHDDSEDDLDNLDMSCFDELEERLGLLIGGIEDIEKKLAKAKLAVR